MEELACGFFSAKLNSEEDNLQMDWDRRTPFQREMIQVHARNWAQRLGAGEKWYPNQEA